jgi:glyoxylase-like metal-dependent hydrolase (beta-lactamase superfamily II)
MRQIDVTPTLTAFESRAAGGMHCGMIATTDGGVILIDPGILPEELAAIREVVAGRPVRLIVQTHAHWDHVMGLSAWPDAPRLASAAFERVREQAAQMLDAVLTGLDQQKAAQYDPRPALLTPTRLVAAREALYETAPGWLVIPAPGHSPDMLALFDASMRTLWSADILSDREPPMLLPGTSAEYLETLDRLETLGAERLVPGHGSIATTPEAVQARFEADRAYLTDLRQRVEMAIERQWSVQDTIALCADMDFPSKDTYGGAHVDNVIAVWGEVLGVPDDDEEEEHGHDDGSLTLHVE